MCGVVYLKNFSSKMVGFMWWVCGKEKICKNNINREWIKYKFEISCIKDVKYI